MGLYPYLVYAVLGMITAVVTIRVFPPMEGFRPGLSTLLLACSVFVVLWPVLVLLALWYNATGRSRPANVHLQPHAPASLTGSVHGMPVKPR